MTEAEEPEGAGENAGADAGVQAGDTPTAQPEPSRAAGRFWLKLAIGVLLAPIVLVLLAYGFLSTPIGKRFIADQIAGYETETGLSVAIGRIEGNLLGEVELYDLDVKDPKGVFLSIPEATLDWRPLNFLWNKLDIREAVVRRGRLERMPELLPGDPDAPILPDFDIRVDRLAIEDLVIAPGLATEDAQRVNITGKADIRDGRALVEADGALGERDRIALLLDAEPDRDRFDLALDYVAPAGGVVAGLAGISDGYRAKIVGEGSWSRWLGHAMLWRDNEGPGNSPEELMAVRLTNREGTYGVSGEVYPGFDDNTILGRAAGGTVALAATGTFADNTVDGTIRAVSTALDLRGSGAIDLSKSRISNFDIAAQLRDPALFGESLRLDGASGTGVLNGTFDDLALEHVVNVAQLESGSVQAFGITQSGTATYDGNTFTVPLSGTVERVVTGSTYVDPSLRSGTLDGLLTFAGTRLAIDNARVRFPNLSGTFALLGDTARGDYALSGPLNVNRLPVDGFGFASGTADLSARFGTSGMWSVNAGIDGRLDDVANSTLVDLAGQSLDIRAQLAVAGDRPITLDDVVLDSQRLSARFASRILTDARGTRTTLVGDGEHVEYGPFTFDAAIDDAGPRAELEFADPYPTAGLKNVRVDLAPSEKGYALDVEGQSILGAFDGAIGLVFPARAPTTIDVERLKIDQTNVTGTLALDGRVVDGDLAVEDGGLNGNIRLIAEEGGMQGFAINLDARNATFAGEDPIKLGEADIDVSGKLYDGRYDLKGDITGAGVDYSGISIAQFTAKTDIEKSEGWVRGTLAGRRVDRFELKFDTNVGLVPDGKRSATQIGLLLRGEYGGRAITMPRRAILTSLEKGGYALAPSQLNFARGFTILEGTLGGPKTVIEAKLSAMPLRLADLVSDNLALGGRVSGSAEYTIGAQGPPTGSADLRIDNFSRAGLLVSSQPMDINAVIELQADQLSVAARLADDGTRLGQLDGTITRLGPGDDLVARIRQGRLNATLDYDGAAEALWRLAALDTFDITGPLSVDARATGSLAQPVLGGKLTGSGLRLQSAISGTDITEIAARGEFEGSKLKLTGFSGVPRGGGSVSGSGTIDLANISAKQGPGIDLRVAVRNANILNAAGLDATLTGPLRILSSGVGGTIAGKVKVDRASWKLGVAEEDLRLPQITTREINRRDGIGERVTGNAGGVWQYLVDAEAEGRVDVDGLGLDSEWALDLDLRGTVNDPRLDGNVRLVRGTYTFAGTRLELTRGRIAFDKNVPINPQLDIIAETVRNGTDVTVTIEGDSFKPNITLSSDPQLPEEEILSQLLFGGSFASLSATDGLQLAAALAALRGGDGPDPIGDLRRSIGLDQLRIVAADPITGQRTGVALGKYLGDRIYVELVTDGQGYSATQLEYRITSWLTLLGTVSTIGRDSVKAEISRDY